MPMAPAKSTGDLLVERFVSKIEKTPECWLWKGTTYNRPKINYGKIQVCGKEYSAHRMSWKIFRGEVPLGMCVLHKCDVPLCVNPDHLWIGTSAENCRDREAKNRSNHGSGEKIATAKLTAREVLEIRSKYDSSRGKYNRLAEEYGVDRKTIAQIVRRKTWQHI